MSQQRLDYGDLAYPQRPQYFALKAIRAAIAAGCFGDLHPKSFAMFCIVADMEDQLFYRRPPNFRNDQMGLLLQVHPNAVERVRVPLVETGWLHYAHRHRRPGWYWVIVPPEWEEAGKLNLACQAQALDKALSNPLNKALDEPLNKALTLLSPSPLPTSLPATAPDQEAAADGELIELLKQAQVEVAPDAVLAKALKLGHTRDAIRSRIRYFLDRGAWSAGFLVFSLRSRDYVGKPADFGWPKLPPQQAEAEQVAAEQSRRASAREIADQQQDRLRSRDRRLQQLQFEFEAVVRSRTPQQLGEQLALPDAIRQRLAAYPRWDLIRNDDLRLVVLEKLAAGEGGVN